VFALGDAASLPVPDGSVDAIVSVFGVIFAPDAEAAAAEMARVLFIDANEDPDALRITSRYVVSTVTA
jgi:ubiquinone/menaquinone biosynthesis C-methylase UbiE